MSDGLFSFDAQERYAVGAKAQATKHQDEAVKAWELLGDEKRYLPQYLSLFKKAERSFVSLKDLVGIACGKDRPGPWFLAAARGRLGISGRHSPRN